MCFPMGLFVIIYFFTPSRYYFIRDEMARVILYYIYLPILCDVLDIVPSSIDNI